MGVTYSSTKVRHCNPHEPTHLCLICAQPGKDFRGHKISAGQEIWTIQSIYTFCGLQRKSSVVDPHKSRLLRTQSIASTQHSQSSARGNYLRVRATVKEHRYRPSRPTQPLMSHFAQLVIEKHITNVVCEFYGRSSTRSILIELNLRNKQGCQWHNKFFFIL